MYLLKLHVILACALLSIQLVWCEVADNDPLCAVYPSKYAIFRSLIKRPEIIEALDLVGRKNVVAPWYTDHYKTSNVFDRVRKQCKKTSRVLMVMYGMSRKDCKDLYSSYSTNQGISDYKRWLQTFIDNLGDYKLMIVLEPDALGLYVSTLCGQHFQYDLYVQTAIEALQQLKDVQIYVDTSHWIFDSDSMVKDAVAVIKRVVQNNKISGFALNTSNYQKTSLMKENCAALLKHFDSKNNYKCVIDTSRNFNGPSPFDEWCNSKAGAIGHPATKDTGDPNIAYYLNVKVPGESDGECYMNRTIDSILGIQAGAFNYELFSMHYNNGYMVKTLNMSTIPPTLKNNELYAPPSQNP